MHAHAHATNCNMCNTYTYMRTLPSSRMHACIHAHVPQQLPDCSTVQLVAHIHRTQRRPHLANAISADCFGGARTGR